MFQEYLQLVQSLINQYIWLIIPIISGLIGWITNLIAIKMLFHPRRAISIFGCTIQGVFPKRQKILAEKIAKVVSEELFSSKDLRASFDNSLAGIDLKQVITQEMDQIIVNKLPRAIPMLGMFLNNELADKIKEVIAGELEGSLATTIEGLAGEVEKGFKVEETVYQKIISFSSERLENLILSVMNKELKFVEYLGGVLGFLIGIIQVLLVSL